MKPHGTKGDVSVIMAFGAWQSRKVTTPPRGSSELRLQGGLLTVPEDAGAANMTKGTWGTELLSSAVQLLSSSFMLPPV